MTTELYITSRTRSPSSARCDAPPPSPHRGGAQARWGPPAPERPLGGALGSPWRTRRRIRAGPVRARVTPGSSRPGAPARSGRLSFGRRAARGREASRASTRAAPAARCPLPPLGPTRPPGRTRPPPRGNVARRARPRAQPGPNARGAHAGPDDGQRGRGRRCRGRGLGGCSARRARGHPQRLGMVPAGAHVHVGLAGDRWFAALPLAPR